MTKTQMSSELPAILCTVVIIYSTIALEIIVHSYINCCSTIKDDDAYVAISKSMDQEELLPVVAEQPQLEATPRSDIPHDVTCESDEIEPSQKQPPAPSSCGPFCIPNPSPNIRANRFIIAILLYAMILTAFIFRMLNDPNPNLWVLWFANILPLFIASLSVLRAVVDCLLVRLGTSLKYVGEEGTDDAMAWPMCMAFYLVFVCIRGATMLPITLLMGMPRRAAGAGPRGRGHLEEDVEMGGEELRGLADHVDDGTYDRGEGGGPPAYDDALHEHKGGFTDPSKAR